MRIVIAVRTPSTDEGTFGMWRLDNGKSFASGELPWRDNQNGISCIPAGTYLCKWITSPKHGKCYQITEVPGRDMIEVHSANFMGDIAHQWTSQLLGCVALGKDVGKLEAAPGVMQMALLHSKQAIGEFEADMCGEDFRLEISEALG